MNRLVALGAASAAALVGAARTVDPAPTDLAVTLAAPATAEAGEIVPLTVAVANGGPGSAEQPRVILALGDLRYRPREASPALHCAGVTTVECRLPLLPAPADSTTPSHASLVVPVRSDGFGPRTITATVTSEALDPDNADDTAAATVRFYVVHFRALRTTAAVAGKRFVFSATLFRDDTGATVTPSWIHCGSALARYVTGIRSPPLRTTHTARGGHITCTIVVPPNTHDKFLIGGLFARARGDFTAKLTFWRRIR